MLLYNEVTFDTQSYFDDSKMYESRLMYIPISTQYRESVPLKVTTTELVLQDNALIMLDKVSMKSKSDLFKVTRMERTPYEQVDKVHISVTFEMDLNVIMSERQVYTIFQMLSDVGGLVSILSYLFYQF